MAEKEKKNKFKNGKKGQRGGRREEGGRKQAPAWEHEVDPEPHGTHLPSTSESRAAGKSLGATIGLGPSRGAVAVLLS